ncbi:hypothetical protein MG296_02215 [Flavobacteriaceae bacterium TK19130]|nr:hypothetical protein [Thermobacterium salinum]
MSMFFVEKKARFQNKHVVHQSDCELLPVQDNCIPLKIAKNSEQALEEASKYYPRVRLCSVCFSDGEEE